MKQLILHTPFFFLLSFLPLTAEEGDDHEGGHEEHHKEDLENQLGLQELQFQVMRQESEFKIEQRKRELKLEMHELQVQQMRGDLAEWHGERNIYNIILLLAMIINVLLAIWVYLDSRSRQAAAGLWIVIVLLSGVFGAIPYSLVRLGDIREAGDVKESKKK
jgi:hypothetical protein